jgi:hypothetical protein
MAEAAEPLRLHLPFEVGVSTAKKDGHPRVVAGPASSSGTNANAFWIVSTARA